MKVLIAASDRDLLMCFKKLIELDRNEVHTVFDGTQAVAQLANNRYDIVILEDHIPRVKGSDIIKHLNDENIPVIVLLHNKINSKILLGDILANSYLSLPFLPYELTELINDVAGKISSNEKLKFSGIELDISEFKLCGGVRLTNEEIDIVKALVKKKEFNAKRAGPYINSLNNKFEKLNKGLRINYVINEGYRLVAENEKS